MMGLEVVLLGVTMGLGAGLPHTQGTLEDAALRFLEGWERADLVGVEGMMRAGGIRLSILGEEHRTVPTRQARAALQDFMDRFPAAEIRLVRSRAAQTDGGQGFADLRLVTRPRGGVDPVIFTVFVGFALESGSWRVTEVRVLS